MWLEEKEYIEWMMGLHWIYIHGKGLCKSEGTKFGLAKGVSSEILQ
jgi:hypothetical protein